MSLEEENIKHIFEGITEHYQVPLRLSNRCEATVYYRVEDLTPEEIDICARYLVERVVNVCQPTLPEVLINLRDNHTGLVDAVARALAPEGEQIEILTLDQVEAGNGYGSRLRSTPVMLVNDVITTARSCLEAHTRTTMRGASILCWLALIDRTFGPGPVPVVAAFTGAPVNLLEEIP